LAEISFGTDGWRAVIADDFTFANIRRVSQAIALHLQEKKLARQGIVIGFDTRFLAEEFAQAVAEVMAGNGIRVYLCARHAPTPAVAYAVKNLKAGGAVMLTASHNPPQYSGIKFIPDYAGPAMPEDVDPIVANLQRITDGGKIKILPLSQAKRDGLLEAADPLPAYARHLEKLIDFAAIREAGIKAVFDPMYGAGMNYLDVILAEHGCELEVIHNWRDPLFGGSLPDPSFRHLKELLERVRESGANIGLALDGDGDRLGAVDGDGRFFSPNEILALFLEYLITYRGERGAVARTVATTHLLDRIAGHYGLSVVETPVGFKYIGCALREQGAFLGGEESGGISTSSHIPEKDGIFAALLFLEMLAKTGEKAAELLAGIQSRFGPVYSERLDFHIAPQEKETILNAMQEWQPKELAGVPVVSVNRIDGVKTVLANGSWCLIRPSGTEPVFRLYVEAGSGEEKKQLQKEIKETFFAHVREE